MKIEKIRELCWAEPFKPFVIHLPDLRHVAVAHPDFIAFFPSGPSFIVVQPDDSESWCFWALHQGVAAESAGLLLDLGCQVIDLSADFRLKSAAVSKDFYGHDHPAPQLLEKAVYGLPECFRAAIQHATLIASPGCYPTSI